MSVIRELRITNYELRITNWELRITNYELGIGNYELDTQKSKETWTLTADFDIIIIAPNGQVLKTEATQSSLKLPATGNYEIVVGGTRGNASYQLNVKIQ